MTRDDLIERAAKAIFAEMHPDDFVPEVIHPQVAEMKAARAALAVFEEPLAPTGDDREALLNTEGWPIPAVVDVVMKRWGNDNDTIRRGGGDWSWKGLAETAIQALAQAGLLRRAEVPEPSIPDGWFPFGSHAPYPWVGLMELSDETDDAGMPRWERPLEPQGDPSNAEVQAAANAIASGRYSGRLVVTDNPRDLRDARAALRAAAAVRGAGGEQ